MICHVTVCHIPCAHTSSHVYHMAERFHMRSHHMMRAMQLLCCDVMWWKMMDALDFSAGA